MAKRKQSSPYGTWKKEGPTSARTTMNEEDLTNIVKGLPAEVEQNEDYRIKTLRGMLEPKPQTASLQGIDVDLPPSPYPFKQPPAMTKALNDSVRRVRQIAPGAGQAQNNVLTNVPPTGYIAGRSDPFDRDAILKGEKDPADMNLLGLAQIAPNKYGTKENPNVYINPKIKDAGLLDSTVAHELSHRNLPATGHGIGTYSGYEGFKPGTDYLEYLLGLQQGKQAPPENMDTDAIIERLTKALIQLRAKSPVK